MNRYLICLLLIGGCSALAPKATQQAVNVVQKYCGTVNLLERQAIREQVNAELKVANPADPPTIKIHCPGDKD